MRSARLLSENDPDVGKFLATASIDAMMKFPNAIEISMLASSKEGVVLD
jgi:hypothetical protein